MNEGKRGVPKVAYKCPWKHCNIGVTFFSVLVSRNQDEQEIIVADGGLHSETEDFKRFEEISSVIKN